jgi:hypothetical protein
MHRINYKLVLSGILSLFNIAAYAQAPPKNLGDKRNRCGRLAVGLLVQIYVQAKFIVFVMITFAKLNV